MIYINLNINGFQIARCPDCLAKRASLKEKNTVQPNTGEVICAVECPMQLMCLHSSFFLYRCLIIIQLFQVKEPFELVGMDLMKVNETINSFV